MDKRKYRYLILILINIASMFLYGCWDAKTIEELNIPIAMGCDIGKNNQTKEDEYKIYSVLPVFYQDAQKKSYIDVTYSRLPGEARIERLLHTSKLLNLGSLQVLVLSNNLAKKGAYDMLDVLLRNQEVKNTVFISVADNDINDIFFANAENYPNIGVYLSDLFENTFDQKFLPSVDLHSFALNVLTPRWHGIAPIISTHNEKINICGYAIFKNDKMVEKINILESRILHIMREEPSRGIWTYTINYDNIPYIVTVNMKSSVKAEVSKSADTYEFDINIKSKGTLIEIVPDNNLYDPSSPEKRLLSNPKLVEAIEKGYEKYMTKEINTLVLKAQDDFKMDIFNLIRFASAKWRNEIEKEDWDEKFSQSNIKVKVKSKLKYFGEKM